MKKDLCELVVIIDESGSMGSVVSDTIGGFNTFLNTHKKLPGEAKLTLVKFDTSYNIVHNGTNIKDVEALNEKTYYPSGMTALLDATGKTIDEVGKRLSSTPIEERPEKVIVMIITDGEENSSKEYKKDKIKKMIEHQQDNYKWEFVFMGADQDAWSNAQHMGMKNYVNFSQADMGKTFRGMAYYSSNSRIKSEDTSLDNFQLSEDELNEKLDELTKDK